MGDSSEGLFEYIERINRAMTKEIEEEANSTLFQLANDLRVLATEAIVRELKSMQNVDQSVTSTPWSRLLKKIIALSCGAAARVITHPM
jgi:hypothetical protein